MFDAAMPTWAERIATPGFTLSNSSPTYLISVGSLGSSVLSLVSQVRDRVGVEEVVDVLAEALSASRRPP